MQVRKKILTEDDSREHCSSRLCRQSQNVATISERKVSELIASTKKKKIAELHSRSDPILGSDLDAVRDFLGDEADDISMSYQASLDHMSYGELVSQGTQKTVFSPPFVHPKFSCGSISNKVDFKSAFINKDQAGHRDISIVDLRTTHLTYDNYDIGKSGEDEFSGIGDLSPEVSAIYLAMQQSKLECIDEKSSHSICEDVCVEPEDDDFDDFDPYLFIKDLPDLSEVVPKYRSMLLPKQTRSCPSITLVLDLDETLVHSTLEPCKDADFAFPVNFNLKEHTIYVRCRPFLRNFMERVATLFETIIFTASQSIYAEQLLNMLDPRRKLFRHRVFRESCVFVEGNYLKDLSVLGRDLARVIIIDNSPQAFGFQLDNGIPIESWFDDASDCELLALLPFLEGLVGVEDVRPLIAKKFNLRQKVESAAHPIDFRR